ncbi:MAG TPA: universal stress protein, partial [Diaminobutyricibacter sp.]
MNERTVLAWDGTEPATAALEWAITRERDRHGTIDLVHIVDDTKVSSDYLAGEAILAAAHERVDAEAARILDRSPNLTINTHIRQGDPFDELVAFTSPEALLVVGTGQRHGLHMRYG